MNKYVKPEISVTKFDVKDVITTSGLILDPTTPDISTPGKDDLEWNSIDLNN